MRKYAHKGTVWFLTVFYSLLLFCWIGLPQAAAATDVWDGSVAGSFTTGGGTSDDPYQIATGAQLAYLASLFTAGDDGTPSVGKYYRLTADIDLNHINWHPIGISYFRGNFDGDGHVISNLSIGTSSSPDTSGTTLGLFASISGAVVKDLGIENVAIYASASNRIGGLAGNITSWGSTETSSTVTNCYTSGILSNTRTGASSYAGGLAGYCSGNAVDNQTVILNCSSTASVTGTSATARVGGLFGSTVLSDIRNCYAAGSVASQNTTNTGGLIGNNGSADCSYSYWNSDASQTISSGAQSPKVGVGAYFTGYPDVTISKTSSEMQSAAFVTLLNAHNESVGNWAIVSGMNGGYPVPFASAPAISLDPATNKTFTAQIEGYGAQTAHSVTINNTGSAETGALTIGLSGTNAASFSLSETGITTIAAGSSGSFTIVPDTGLTPGTYTATVTVSGASVTSQSFNVSFTVNAATYTVEADKTTLAFGSKVEGYSAAPAAQTVTITNKGNSSVDVTLPADSNYSITTSDSLTLAPGGTAAVSIQPEIGLTAGTYNPTLTFTTDHSTSDAVDVTFTVETATYTIEANKTSLDFGSKVEGYATAPAAQSVTITNTGNSSVDITLPADLSYSITTSDSLTLAPGGTAAVSIQPETGLTAGSYNPTLTFTTDHATSDAVDATFTVETATYTIEANKTSLDFGSKVEGYSAAPAAQTVTIENTGNSSVTVTLPADSNYSITTSDSLTLAPGGTAAVSIQPKTGLSEGLYNPTLTFTTDHATSDAVDATFTVETATYTIEADKTSLDFGSKVEGYATAPDAQTVTITNTGNSSVTVTLPTNGGYNIATADSLTLAPSATASVSVRPTTGLGAGNYNPTLTFDTDHSTSANVSPSFTVVAAAYTITANPATLDFGSKVEGYGTAPAAQTVTIENTGNSSVTVTLPTNTNYTIATADSLTLAPGGTAAVSVQPKTGLSEGTYNPALTFTTDHSTSDSVDVTFTVGAATYTVEADKTSLDFGTEVEGYATAPAAQTVTIENTGNSSVTVTLPTNTNYTIATADSLTLAPGGTTAVSIRPKTGLSEGTYNPTLTFTTDHSTSDTLDVNFTVSAAVYELTASPTTINFGSQTAGYAPVAEQTVTITNDGNKISTIVQPSAVHFTVGSLSRTVLNPGSTATFTVKPKDDLPVSAYAETVSVEGTGSAETGTDVAFEVLPKSYGVTGDEQYYQFSPDGLVFTSSGSFADFTGVTVDGVPLTSSQYGAEEGSTIVTLYTAYLNTLPLGSHALQMLFKDGAASTDFSVLPVPVLPDTGDDTTLSLYIALAIAALAALAAMMVIRRKGRIS